jgi:hypothetical protein
MRARIELYEKYVTNSEDEIEEYDRMGLELKLTFGYRRINVLLKDIFYPREIDGNNQESIIVFKGRWGGEGTSIIVKGSYDDICIQLNDIENSKIE